MIMMEIIFPWVCVSNCNNCNVTDGCLYHSLVDISDGERRALRSVMVQLKLNWCFVKCINSELSVQQSIVAVVRTRGRHFVYVFHIYSVINPLNPELNPICYLLALLGVHHFLHVSRIRVKLLTLRRLMSYIYIWSTHS